MNTENFERIEKLDEEQKIKFFGGKTKAALYDAGLLNREDYFKPLKNIDLAGIMIPDKTAMNHSIIGDYILPSPLYKNGRLDSGGHTVDAMAEMNKRGIIYNVTRTASNGVMFGNVPEHKDKRKQTGEKQTWFPASWTEHDILAAGIYTAKNGVVPSYNQNARQAKYKNLNIHILIDNERIGTISPSEDQ